MFKGRVPKPCHRFYLTIMLCFCLIDRNWKIGLKHKDLFFPWQLQMKCSLYSPVNVNYGSTTLPSARLLFRHILHTEKEWTGAVEDLLELFEVKQNAFRAVNSHWSTQLMIPRSGHEKILLSLCSAQAVNHFGLLALLIVSCFDWFVLQVGTSLETPTRIHNTPLTMKHGGSAIQHY